MTFRLPAALCVGLMVSLLVGMAFAQDEKRRIRRGAGLGAAGGAALGLALGAVAGEPGAGAAVGAAAGAASMAMYEYDQKREDQRIQMIADGLAGKSQGGTQQEAESGAKPGETVGAAGRRHFEDFQGDWNLSIWALDAEGKKVTASGKAKGSMSGKDSVRIDYSDLQTPGYDQAVTGSSVLGYASGKGFTLENKFSTVPQARTYVGEYLPGKNSYNFYPSQTADGKTVTGVIRSNVRIEFRVSGSNLMVAETYSTLDGKETKIQEYRFAKQ